jgi:hypothetical protein
LRPQSTQAFGDDKRDSTTANTINTPQRHFSHTVDDHDVGDEPLRDVASVLRGEPAIADSLLVAVVRLREEVVGGVAVDGPGAVFTLTGADAAPARSRSPMFGRSRIVGVQNCGACDLLIDAEVATLDKTYVREGLLEFALLNVPGMTPCGESLLL